MNENPESVPTADPTSLNPTSRGISDDWLAMLCAGILLLVSFAAVWTTSTPSVDGKPVKFSNPLKGWIAKPATWVGSPIDSLVVRGNLADHLKQPYEKKPRKPLTWLPGRLPWVGTLGAFLALGVLLSITKTLQGQNAFKFFMAFTGVFLLASIAYLLAGHAVVKSYNLEYALWALGIGLIISNTIGTPAWLRPAVSTEFFIKTGLVLLGAEVLMSRLMALGLPGVFVAWVVTPIVLISTYAFGQLVLKMDSRSLNMVISADMSVCGVSAAIASAAACKAKKEELTLAIGMSLSFTVLMMVVMPIFIKWIELDEMVAGAWMGGTIDATGAVVAAGATLGDRAAEVAATVKMIQNILIGVSAFGIATYWVTFVEKDSEGKKPSVSEIWKRFPRFVLGFLAVSIVFSTVYGLVEGGPEIVNAMTKGSTKSFRGWLFCLAFVSIGLETRFKDLLPYLKGGKPLVLYICGQTLNIILTFLMAYLMFGYFFKDMVK